MDTAPHTVVLSERQRRVLWMVSTGRTRDEIARTLECTPDSVGGFVKRVLRALDASNSPQAVRIGLLDGHIGPYEDCGTLLAYRRHLKRDEPVCACCKRGSRERTDMEALRRARPQLNEAQVRLLHALNAGRSQHQILRSWGVSERVLTQLVMTTYAVLGVDQLAPPLRREAALREARARGVFGDVTPAAVPGRPRASLSNTQARILAEMESGASICEVAERLGMSCNACRSRLSEAYQRLGVALLSKADRRAAALRRARDWGLLPARVDA